MSTELMIIVLQLLLVLCAVMGLLAYLWRTLMFKSRNLINSKAILITGCDTGLGHELARHMDNLGFYVFAGCLDTGSEGAQRLRVESSARLKLVNMDVTRIDHVQHAIKFVEENLPAGEQGLYALINNAGVCVCGEFEWQTWSQIQRQIDVNLLGTLRVTKLCLPLLKAAQGRILNVSSVAGLYGYPGLSVYCASKHAVEGAAAVLRQELEKFSVHVITMQPGDFSKATQLLDNHHRNMNEMWCDMSPEARDEYKDYFILYHNGVARSGVTGKLMKPVTVLPKSLIAGFENALLTTVPSPTYMLLPNSRSQMKMNLLKCVPAIISQHFVGKKYRKSLPKLLPRRQLDRPVSRSPSMQSTCKSCSGYSCDTSSVISTTSYVSGSKSPIGSITGSVHKF